MTSNVNAHFHFSSVGEVSRHEMPLPPSAGCASTAFLTHAPFSAFDANKKSRILLDFLDPGLARPRTSADHRDSMRCRLGTVVESRGYFESVSKDFRRSRHLLNVRAEPSQQRQFHHLHAILTDKQV
ncbi:hypothetical protein RRG08_029713 [Elysia crispata]|uniref:Uncharacterized protein n=1 Tax=Elysia crispata TaxID=231223 RepID=A0AAE1A2G1_9GAST|nr:hypothetical protein RRG08_029713 [Elysia crispata]